MTYAVNKTSTNKQSLFKYVAFEIQCGSDFLLFLVFLRPDALIKKNQCIQLPLNERPFVDCLTHFNRKQTFQTNFHSFENCL